MINLEYKVIDINDKEVIIQIVSQNNCIRGRMGFHASNGIVISSECYPDYSCIDYRPKVLHIQGIDMEKDDTHIKIPILDWGKVYKAIEEYNNSRFIDFGNSTYIIPKDVEEKIAKLLNGHTILYR